MAALSGNLGAPSSPMPRRSRPTAGWRRRPQRPARPTPKDSRSPKRVQRGCVMVQSANTARRTDPQLAAVYHRQMTRHGAHHQKALTIVAARLAERFWTVMARGTPYVICDTDGTPVTPTEAKAIIATRFTVPEDVRAQRRSRKPAKKKVGKAPHQVLTAQVIGQTLEASTVRGDLPRTSSSTTDPRQDLDRTHAADLRAHLTRPRGPTRTRDLTSSAPKCHRVALPAPQPSGGSGSAGGITRLSPTRPAVRQGGRTRFDREPHGPAGGPTACPQRRSRQRGSRAPSRAPLPACPSDPTRLPQRRRQEMSQVSA